MYDMSINSTITKGHPNGRTAMWGRGISEQIKYPQPLFWNMFKFHNWANGSEYRRATGDKFNIRGQEDLNK